MSVKYLLPCRCGQQVAIEPRQAGQTIVCPCGESLPVPTMLEITALEPAPEESLPTLNGEGWGWQDRMVLLGAMTLLAAMVFGVWLFITRPIAPIDTLDPEFVRQSAEKLAPSVTWRYWAMMKQGLDRRTDQRYEAAMVRFQVWRTLAVVLALAGAGLIGMGAAMRKRGGERGRGEGGDLERG